ncbi:hypothetical protein OQY15_07365 [Pedobacter sp. MC2016-15]|uniref:hypothetical protein n=1 Tax=Pedobacter sp. MC2016-15 TaxID=2994473 RepID=UPI002247969A|nr:hypothetical protein [Pedobacter sp. MC2016-15]MCX2478905.1 hypothetical protein [Pedobacter sp. MC2016-15]
MRKTCCIIILCFFYFGTVAQNVAVVNSNPISQKEFVWVYKKHRPGNTQPTLTELISFLNIYIDFKLKVEDARAAGLDKDSTYLADTKNYEDALTSATPPEAQQVDYSLVIREYKEALLLFNISQVKIWDKIGEEEDTIQQYYNTHKQDYSSKPFDEVQTEVTADYQKKIECDWVTSLRNKYKITIDQNLLGKLIR